MISVMDDVRVRMDVSISQAAGEGGRLVGLAAFLLGVGQACEETEFGSLRVR